MLNRTCAGHLWRLNMAFLAFFALVAVQFHAEEPELEASGHNTHIFIVESECWNRLDLLRKRQDTGYWARSAICFFDRTLNNGSGAWVIRPI